jgi:hypothetical protein
MTRDIFNEAGDVDPVKWDPEFAEVEVDGKPCSIADLATVKKAHSITVSGAYGDIKLADGLQADSVSFYNCHGAIEIGRGTTLKTGLQVDQCTKIERLPADLTAGLWLVVSDCEAFESIGPNLTVNPRQEWNGNGVIVFRVDNCPNFRRIEGPATLNAAVVAHEVPHFEGLAPDVALWDKYECYTDLHPRQRDYLRAPSEAAQARQELRDLWAERHKQTPAPGPAPKI